MSQTFHPRLVPDHIYLGPGPDRLVISVTSLHYNRDYVSYFERHADGRFYLGGQKLTASASNFIAWAQGQQGRSLSREVVLGPPPLTFKQRVAAFFRGL